MPFEILQSSQQASCNLQNKSHISPISVESLNLNKKQQQPYWVHTGYNYTNDNSKPAQLTENHYPKRQSMTPSMLSSNYRRVFSVKQSPPVQIYDLSLLVIDNDDTKSSTSNSSSPLDSPTPSSSSSSALSTSLMSSSSTSSGFGSFVNGSGFISRSASLVNEQLTGLNGGGGSSTSLFSSSDLTAASLQPLTNHNRHHSSSADDEDEPSTFQDLISSIINSESGVDWQQLIIQDLSRQLELKFREFKKKFVEEQHQDNNNLSNNNISVGLDSDLFTKIAHKIFEIASDEPNGIWGARLRIKFMLDNGQVLDVCPVFPYSNTLATSEITVTLHEDVRPLRRFFMRRYFKSLCSNMGKYFAIYIDQNNYDIDNKKLY